MCNWDEHVKCEIRYFNSINKFRSETLRKYEIRSKLILNPNLQNSGIIYVLHSEMYNFIISMRDIQELGIGEIRLEFDVGSSWDDIIILGLTLVLSCDGRLFNVTRDVVNRMETLESSSLMHTPTLIYSPRSTSVHPKFPVRKCCSTTEICPYVKIRSGYECVEQAISMQLSIRWLLDILWVLEFCIIFYWNDNHCIIHE